MRGGGFYKAITLKFFVKGVINSTLYLKVGDQVDVSDIIKSYMGPAPFQNRAYFVTYNGNFIGFLSATNGPKYHLSSQATVMLVKDGVVDLYEFDFTFN